MYTNKSNEKYSIDLLQYYISNIQLIKENGSTYTIPQDSSYFLITAPNATSIQLQSLPPSTYKGIVFTLGIDSARCTKPLSQRKGVLDPGLGMYWTWNQGYIFLKMEGISDAAPVDGAGEKRYLFHIGGFGGYPNKTFNNIKTVSLTFPNPIIISTNKVQSLDIIADLSYIFDGMHTISIKNDPAITFSLPSIQIADNYASMFSIK